MTATRMDPGVRQSDTEPGAAAASAGRAGVKAFTVLVTVVVACVLLSVAFVKGARHQTPGVAPVLSVPVAAAVAPAAGPLNVDLTEYAVNSSATIVKAGQVTLNISNSGKIQHELLVFKADLAPSTYPVADGDVDEESPAVNKVSDGDNLDPGGTQARTVDLTQPGTYLFVCNLPGHFAAGMYEQVIVK